MSSNPPVVRFPNFLNGIAALLLDIVFFAYHDNRLPSRYLFIRANMPANYRPEHESLDEAFTVLKDVKDLKELGAIPGVLSNKDLLREISTGYFYRAIGCCHRLKEWFSTEKGKDAEELNHLDDVADWRHFVSDLSLLRSILDSRHPYIGTTVLSRYLIGLESIQIIVGHNNDIESMCRKLRAITRPKPRHTPRVPDQAKVIQTAIKQIEQMVVKPAEPEAAPTPIAPVVMEIDEVQTAKDAEELRDLLNPVDPTAGEAGA